MIGYFRIEENTLLSNSFKIGKIFGNYQPQFKKVSYSPESFDYNYKLLSSILALKEDVMLFGDSKVVAEFSLSLNQTTIYINDDFSHFFNVRNYSSTFTDSVLKLLPNYNFRSLKYANIVHTYNTNYADNTPFADFNYNIRLTSLVFNSSSLAKQFRWLEKNSIVSRNLSIYNNKYINSKSFIDTNLFDNKVSNHNLSVSNFFSVNKLNFNKDNFSANNKHIIQNFSRFEDSRDWVQKKYLLGINIHNLLIEESPYNYTTKDLPYTDSHNVQYLILSSNLISYLSDGRCYLSLRYRNSDLPLKSVKIKVTNNGILDFIDDYRSDSLMFSSYIVNAGNLSGTDSYVTTNYSDCINTRSLPYHLQYIMFSLGLSSKLDPSSNVLKWISTLQEPFGFNEINVKSLFDTLSIYFNPSNIMDTFYVNKSNTYLIPKIQEYLNDGTRSYILST
jgi:hypothetical protein